ncbi:nuclear transport factor 2 family protein [Amycolatopsis rhabdoformis]|uniref:Nuclear transport factor 2 family protein n=1 Tax=Amycolatopsis rhabdoformis TaxID=1448059 RepID=A0ABZ1I1D9_9PSEU|nr:nuclear transport factor 2 family protein [Amycolatopsis rhabdoformis]WSE28215.1 nuclear transport factor 2 family protein [Amycolatopsis rhabdoformis]
MAEHPNATLIRRGYAAFSTGDVDTLTELLSADAVQHMPGHNTFSGDHKGRDAILAMYGELASRSDGTLQVILEEVYANDDEVVTVYHSTGTRGDKHLDTRHALVFRMRDGKAVDLLDVSQDESADDAFWA